MVGGAAAGIIHAVNFVGLVKGKTDSGRGECEDPQKFMQNRKHLGLFQPHFRKRVSIFLRHTLFWTQLNHFWR